MGGDGSMVQWVEDVPARANKDYTHFNYRGAKQVAGMIYNQLYTGYIEYKKLRTKAILRKKNGAVSIKQDLEETPQQKDTLNE